MNEMTVTFREDSNYAQCIRYEHGLEISNRKALAEEVVASLLCMLENDQILSLLNRNTFKGILSEFFEKVIAYDKSMVTEMTEHLTEAILNCDNKTERYVNLLGVVYSKVNKELSNSDHDDFYKQIFTDIVKSSKGEWVDEALAARRPDAVIAQSPILPKNCIYYQEHIDRSKTVAIEVPKGKHDVSLSGVDYKQTGQPQYVFVFRVKNDKIINMKICTFKKQIIDFNSKVCAYPFSHVYHDFRVCWGYGGEKLKSLKHVEIFPSIFINTPNSHDLGGNTASLFSRFEGIDFDDQLLEETNFTFGDIIMKM